jgi:DNA modification methylase
MTTTQLVRMRTKRKSRVWATTPEVVLQLGRSARRLARVSANRIQRPAVAQRLNQFLQLTAVENASKLMRADLLVRLVDEDGLRAIDIARETGLRQVDLCQMLATARTFPPGARPAGVPYNIFLLATRMLRKFPELGLSPAVVLGEIRRMQLSQHRDVTRHFSQLAQYAEMRAVLPGPHVPDGDLINSAHHARFQDLLHRVPDGAAKIIHVDPPYVYRTTTHGGYASSSARSRACDNGDGDAAIELVIDLLRDWQPKLAPGGVLLLWQASGPLHHEILDAIDQYEWELTGPVIWDKSRPQPGDLGAPYSRQTEMVWVLSRPSDELINHDGSSRSDILRFASVSYPTIAHEQNHCFEKPVKLCEFLITKHSHRGELVLDLCGCTGAMTLAAMEMDRRWTYVESNADNFRLGAARIRRRLIEEHEFCDRGQTRKSRRECGLRIAIRSVGFA